ncbi:hypothetical protein BLNAU_15656 [Blattamonas nauphoetae]|uniref:Saposin B-type domain-containing protein n=1 Tax=Blattamonas nauphoetae TaxID=2049346 RepID=A0ABQ9XDM1_9EUKA|nr:hypothetical protein BLNAU_15656 [Blattamonas nauphoetae]
MTTLQPDNPIEKTLLAIVFFEDVEQLNTDAIIHQSSYLGWITEFHSIDASDSTFELEDNQSKPQCPLCMKTASIAVSSGSSSQSQCQTVLNQRFCPTLGAQTGICRTIASQICGPKFNLVSQRRPPYQICSSIGFC